jgi:hypothetical protein
MHDTTTHPSCAISSAASSLASADRVARHAIAGPLPG